MKKFNDFLNESDNHIQSKYQYKIDILDKDDFEDDLKNLSNKYNVIYKINLVSGVNSIIYFITYVGDMENIDIINNELKNKY